MAQTAPVAQRTVVTEQIVPLTGKNLVRARIAAADAVLAFEQARREQLDVLAKARASYFRLANANAQLELNRRNLTSLRQLAEVSRSRYEVGKANAADALAAELEASKLLESEQDILRNISAEQSQLNVLMNRDAFARLGQPQETRIISSDVSMDEARARMFASRPEIKIAQAKNSFLLGSTMPSDIWGKLLERLRTTIFWSRFFRPSV